MKKNKFLIILIFIIMLGFIFVACDINNHVIHTVTFNENGGTATDYMDGLWKTQLVEDGKRVNRPEDGAVIKPNHCLAGWGTDAAATALFDFSTPITKDITLYAVWELTVVGELMAALSRTIDNLTGVLAHETSQISINESYVEKFLYKDGILEAFEMHWGSSDEDTYIYTVGFTDYYVDKLFYSYTNATGYYDVYELPELPEYHIDFITPAGLFQKTIMGNVFNYVFKAEITEDGFLAKYSDMDEGGETLSVKIAGGFITGFVYQSPMYKYVMTVELFTTPEPFVITLPAV